MVTEIFGIINLKDGEASKNLMYEQAKYKVGHSWHEKQFDNGRSGCVLIGNNKEDNPQIPLMHNDSLIICADVTLYNRDDLNEKLRLGDDCSDTACILHAYRKWGHGCVNYIEGDFAFAIWDSKKRELFCARDPVGIRPFYYSQQGQGFVFASELRFVSAAMADGVHLSDGFLLDSLVTVVSEKHETAFDNIFRLPPAHRLIFRNGIITMERYLELDTKKTLNYNDEYEYVESFRKLLIKAIEKRCTGTESIASELSGGLDSTLVSCVAAGYATSHGLAFGAFSNTLPDNHGTVMIDEKSHIKKVLEWKNFNWHEVNGLSATIPEILEDTLQTQGCFTQQRFHMFNRGIYEAAGKSGAGILLSGFGGDEMVSARTGNAWFDMIHEKQWRKYYQALAYNTFLLKAGAKGLKLLLHYYLNRQRQPGVTSGVFTPALLQRRLKTLPLQAQFIKENKLGERYFSKHRKNDFLFLADRQKQKVSHPHVSQRMEYSYAAAACYGLQYRYPLLDIGLLQMCLSFPAWIKNRPGTDRYLFRQAMKDLVPEEIRLRSDKTGAVIPHMYTRLQKDRMLLSDLFKTFSTDRYLREIFDYSRFDTWMDMLLERSPDDMNYLMPGAFYNHLMVMQWYIKQR
ncbi:MAG: asparagine synthase-related protein [Bacteroidales bacterium]